MNYRHAFHAGNFADLVKHAAVTLILDRLLAAPEPLLVIDTHAGAGRYDLTGEMATKSREAEAGVVRLMADDDPPRAFAVLKASVRSANRDRALRVYPGSPLLIAGRLRQGDAYVGAELRDDDFAALTEALASSRGRAQAVKADGYDLLAERAKDPRRLFVLIDPPFEQADDYANILKAIQPVLRRRAPATTLIWMPLKDLETFDGFLRGLEALDPGAVLVAETRLNPLTDPMKMNGCALVILNPPEDVEAGLASAAQWVVDNAGGPGGRAKLWRLDGA